ncbi:MAG: tRNA glutamyl-Q(34) synthetase GluQRS [Ruminococcaceae bacterium]|nr:tRNA glutamyl-Q(34) synthetase GluQRS [Oscillospiraceae bacterium]
MEIGEKSNKTLPVVGRFAPTPSGRLHLGNLMCAMLSWLSAKAAGGKVILRIEDLDAARCPFMGENTKYLLDDLAWMGLAFDGEVLWQSGRSAIYDTFLDKLKEKDLLYPCYCSRAELHAATAPHRADGVPKYDRKCWYRLQNGEPPPRDRKPALRVKVPNEIFGFVDGLQGEYSENLEADCSDFVVRRSDGVYAYQLAVVVDDGLSGVSEIVRGNDLLDSTPRQMFLQKIFGFSHPVYRHIPLLTDANGRRLSKREGDGCMERVRAAYPDPAPVIGALAAALGLLPSPESMRLKDLISLFDWSKIPRGAVLLPEGF